MHTILAALPLIVAFALLALGARATRAACAAVVCAVLVSVLDFPVSLVTARSTARSLGPTLIEVLVILLGGIVLNEALTRSGAQHQLAAWIQNCCTDPGRAVLLIVLGVTPFAESVTGFGIGVVVAVPLLRHLGIAPAKAATLGLLGLVIVPWGALAPGTLVAAELGGVEFDSLGVRSAELSGPVFLIIGTAALVVTLGWRRVPAALVDLVVIAGALWIGVWTANLLLGTPLAGAFGGLAATVAALCLSWARDREPIRIDAATRRAVRPYVVLLAGLLVSSLLVRTVDGLEAWHWLASPGIWLTLTCFATPSLVGLRGEDLGAALASAMRRWWPIAAATALFLVLGGILTASGMSSELAVAASHLGVSYMAMVPFIGGLGGYIAGSNTGANAMFAASQAHVAQVLGASPLQVLATQNVSASLLTMAAPPRVALAAGLAHAGISTSDTTTVQQAPTASMCSPTHQPNATLEELAATASTGPLSTRSVVRTVLLADLTVLTALGVINLLGFWFWSAGH